jgi:hypothetical protein
MKTLILAGFNSIKLWCNFGAKFSKGKFELPIKSANTILGFHPN